MRVCVSADVCVDMGLQLHVRTGVCMLKQCMYMGLLVFMCLRTRKFSDILYFHMRDIQSHTKPLGFQKCIEAASNTVVPSTRLFRKRRPPVSFLRTNVAAYLANPAMGTVLTICASPEAIQLVAAHRVCTTELYSTFQAQWGPNLK